MNTKKNKPHAPKFAVHSRDGKDEFFIHVNESGINLMCLMFDAPELTWFGKSDGPYLTVDQAIAWYEKESRHAQGEELERCRNNIVALNSYRTQFILGNYKG